MRCYPKGTQQLHSGVSVDQENVSTAQFMLGTCTDKSVRLGIAILNANLSLRGKDLWQN